MHHAKPYIPLNLILNPPITMPQSTQTVDEITQLTNYLTMKEIITQARMRISTKARCHCADLLKAV